MTSIKRVVDLAIKFSNETYEHGLISAAKKTYRKVLRKNMVPVTDYNVWMAKFDTLRESDVEGKLQVQIEHRYNQETLSIA